LLRWLAVSVLPFLVGCSLLIELPFRAAAEASRPHAQVPFETARQVPETRVFDKEFLASREGTAEIRLIRDDPDGLDNRSALISIGDRLVADVHPGETITVWLPPGRHRVKFRMQLKPDHPHWVPFDIPQTTRLKIDVKAGEITTIRAFTTGMGPYLRLVAGGPDLA
jgi:hypothetical protein